MKALEIPAWGPKKLREIFKAIQDAINARTPIKGAGIGVSENPDGVQISAAVNPPADGSLVGAAGGGSGGGTSFPLYGALNGAPATYPVLLSSPPTPL